MEVEPTTQHLAYLRSIGALPPVPAKPQPWRRLLVFLLIVVLLLLLVILRPVAGAEVAPAGAADALTESVIGAVAPATLVDPERATLQAEVVALRDAVAGLSAQVAALSSSQRSAQEATCQQVGAAQADVKLLLAALADLDARHGATAADMRAALQFQVGQQHDLQVAVARVGTVMAQRVAGIERRVWQAEESWQAALATARADLARTSTEAVSAAVQRLMAHTAGEASTTRDSLLAAVADARAASAAQGRSIASAVATEAVVRRATTERTGVALVVAVLVMGLAVLVAGLRRHGKPTATTQQKAPSLGHPPVSVDPSSSSPAGETRQPSRPTTGGCAAAAVKAGKPSAKGAPADPAGTDPGATPTGVCASDAATTLRERLAAMPDALAIAQARGRRVQAFGAHHGGAVTDQGPVRADNQDCVLAARVGDFEVAVICDGVGGTPLGGEAARFAADAAFLNLVTKLGDVPVSAASATLQALCCAAIEAAARRLAVVAAECHIAAHSHTAGFRTTMICILASPSRVACAHLGDGGAVLGRASGETVTLLTPHRDPAGLLTGSLGPTTAGGIGAVVSNRGCGDVILAGTDGVFDRVTGQFPAEFRAIADWYGGDLHATVEHVISCMRQHKDEIGFFTYDDNTTLVAIGLPPASAPRRARSLRDLAAAVSARVRPAARAGLRPVAAWCQYLRHRLQRAVLAVAGCLPVRHIPAAAKGPGRDEGFGPAVAAPPAAKATTLLQPPT